MNDCGGHKLFDGERLQDINDLIYIISKKFLKKREYDSDNDKYNEIQLVPHLAVQVKLVNTLIYLIYDKDT